MIDATVTAALAALEAAIADAGTLQNASQSTLAPILVAVNTTLSAIDANVAAIEATIDQTSVGGLHIGTPAPQLISILITQTTAVTDLAALETTRGYVARIGANIENAPG